MILIFKRQRVIGLDTIREIRVSTRDQHQVTLQRAVFLDWSSAVNLGMKTIVRTQDLQSSAFGEQLRGGTRHEEFRRIQFINHVSGICRNELDTEARVSKL